MSLSTIEKLKKLHSVMAIQEKTSLKDLFTGKEKKIVMEVVAISSKYVPKYDKTSENGSKGFITLFHMKDGTQVGAFSNAMRDFGTFFFKMFGMNPDEEFNYLNFNGKQPNGFVKVEVSKVELKDNKTTYNFKILDGDVGEVERLTDAQTDRLLIAATTEE
jgi:hypothetical protein